MTQKKRKFPSSTPTPTAPSSRKTARTDRTSSPSEKPDPVPDRPVSTDPRPPARGGPTKRKLVIPPGSQPGEPLQTGPSVKKARRDQVDQVLDAAPTRPEEEEGEGDRPAPDEEEVRKAIQKSVADQWLTPQQSEKLPQLFGRAGHQALVQMIMLDLEKPGMLDSAIKSAQSDELPRPLSDNTTVLLPDAAFAWRRVNSHVDGLIRRLDALSRAEPPWVGARAAAALSIPDNRIKAYRKAGVAKVVEALEMAVVGNLPRLLQIMIDSEIGEPADWQGREHMDWPPVPLPAPSRPSESLISQAQGIAAAAGEQVDLRLGPLGAGLVPGCFAVRKLCDASEDDSKILDLVDQQLRPRFKEASAAALFDLAYLSHTLGGDGQKPTVVTADWNLLDGLSGRPGTAGRQTAAYEASIGGVNVRVQPLKTPANPQLAPTPMRQLAEDAPSTVMYGTQVTVKPDTEDEEKDFTAFVYGYDMQGRVRVMWEEDRETLQLLDSTSPVTVWKSPEGQIFLRDDMPVVSPPSPHSITHFEWKPKTYSLDELRDAFRDLAGFVNKLPELAKRPVAARADLTVNQYVELIVKAGFQCYVTGGAVRDILLGLDPNDVDLASTMPAPDLYADIVTSQGMGKKGGRRGEPEVRKNFPFSIVQIEPTMVTGLDILSTHDRIHGNSSLSLDMDALARDFTINALYFDPTKGSVIDPTGFGLQDIRDKTLRFVCDPGKAITADPVLAARWIKFMNKNTYTAADQNDWIVVTERLSAAIPTMDSVTCGRFVDRSGLSPKELVAAAEKISPSLTAAIRKITGT